MCKFVFVFLHNYYFIVNQGDGEKKEGMELYGKEKNKKIEDMERKERIGLSIGR